MDTRPVGLVELDQIGLILHIHVFRREKDYGRGRFVTWEWNTNRGTRINQLGIDTQLQGSRSTRSHKRARLREESIPLSGTLSTAFRIL